MYSISSCQTLNITSFSEHIIIGTGTAGATLHIKPTSAVAEIQNVIPQSGSFSFTLNTLVVGESAVIWETTGTIESEKIVRTIITDAQMLSNSAVVQPSSEALARKRVYDQKIADNFLLKNTKATYRRTIITTNFTIPVARFDVAKTQYDAAGNSIYSDSKGSISLFSSFGAGIGISGGRFTETRGSNGEIIDEEFSNAIGGFIGILYQAATGEDRKNVFAPTIAVTALDIQLGVGYDYGTVPASQERIFITLSYGIPLYKLFGKSFRSFLTSDPGTPVEVRKL